MSRLDEARKVALEILPTFELAPLGIEFILMKTKRLAQLMRDTDAQAWLDLEIRGYPQDFRTENLGSCQKYALASGRLTTDGRYYLSSLIKLEAQTRADEASIEAIRSTPKSSLTATDYVAKGATEALLATQLKTEMAQKELYVSNKGLFAAIKSGIHGYVTDVYLAIELGDVAQNIFEKSREEVDRFIRAHCPQAAEQLLAINERLNEESSESRSAALTSCRRLLLTVADSLFPPQEQPFLDSKGKTRKVGPEEYKNRLLAYLDGVINSESNMALITSEIEHLSARLDAVNDKVCKGVHDNVSKDEARLAVIHTYLFLGEITRVSSVTQRTKGFGQ